MTLDYMTKVKVKLSIYDNVEKNWTKSSQHIQDTCGKIIYLRKTHSAKYCPKTKHSGFISWWQNFYIYVEGHNRIYKLALSFVCTRMKKPDMDEQKNSQGLCNT